MTLRAAVVGLGAQAREDHLPGLAASDTVELIAICDDNPDVIHELQYQLHVKGYTNYREMFASEALDLVVVCVPHHVGRTSSNAPPSTASTCSRRSRSRPASRRRANSPRSATARGSS